MLAYPVSVRHLRQPLFFKQVHRETGNCFLATYRAFNASVQVGGFMATGTPASVRPRVVVIGAGFGGIYAAKKLGKLPVDVTVVDRKNHHTFQPLLYQVALAVLSPGEIAQPIRSILRDCGNTEVIMDEVVGFDIRERRVHLKSGAEL